MASFRYILAVLLFSIASAIFTIPSSPSPCKDTVAADGYIAKCFLPHEPKAYPIDLPICNEMSEWILTSSDITKFFEKQRFIRGKKVAPTDYEVPDAWAVQEGKKSCAIEITSYEEERPDYFSLCDVRMAADTLIRECPSRTKEGLGGLTVVGMKGFYVTVNGALPKDEKNLTAAQHEFDEDAKALSRLRNIQID